jgi:hypothetical protein
MAAADLRVGICLHWSASASMVLLDGVTMADRLPFVRLFAWHLERDA